MNISGGALVSHRVARGENAPLSLDQIRNVAPSVFATSKHESRSERYTYMPTINVVQALLGAGFQPYYAAQANNRTADRLNHARHILRFRHPQMKQGGDGFHEIILVNSHDGTSAYQLISGYYRLVCSNGLVTSHTAHDIRLPHKGVKDVDEIIDVAYEIIAEQDTRIAALEHMRSTKMPYDRQLAFARAGMLARFGENGMHVEPTELLRPRRFDDGGDNEWVIYNRVQENLTHGGFYGRSTNGKERKVSGIRGANKDLDFNRRLWQIFDDVRNGKEPKASSSRELVAVAA